MQLIDIARKCLTVVVLSITLAEIEFIVSHSSAVVSLFMDIYSVGQKIDTILHKVS